MDQVAGWFQCLSSRDGVGLKVDAFAVCHEIRCPGLEQGVQTCASFQVLGGGQKESLVEVGGLCKLPSLQLGSVVLLRIYASADESPTAARAQRKACGEVHIPLRQLVSKFDNMLYHTWLTLEKPGLLDSVAGMGLFAQSEDDAFAQAMHNGARQLHQPQACVSLCKEEDLSPSGQPIWTADVPKKDRIAHWAPLLRAQQQATMLCTLQHLQNPQPSGISDMEAPQKQSQALAEREQEQQQELRALRERLRGCQERGGIATQSLSHDDDRWASLRQLNDKGYNQLEESRRLVTSLANRGRGKDGQLGVELERQRTLATELQRELDALQEDLASTGEEARRKFGEQEAGLAVLQRDRDEALRSCELREAEVQQLIRVTEKLTADKAKLLKENDDLSKIVEDLHEACGIAGLPTGGREPINSIMGFNYP